MSATRSPARARWNKLNRDQAKARRVAEDLSIEAALKSRYSSFSKPPSVSVARALGLLS
jgi:hypothetical protein